MMLRPATALWGGGGVLEKDPADFLDGLGIVLSGVAGSQDHLLGLDAVDVRARILDHAVVAGFDRGLP